MKKIARYVIVGTEGFCPHPDSDYTVDYFLGCGREFTNKKEAWKELVLIRKWCIDVFLLNKEHYYRVAVMDRWENKVMWK